MPGQPQAPAKPVPLRHVPCYGESPARPDLLLVQERPGGPLVTLTAGRALVALRAELAACRVPVTGMDLARWEGTLKLPGGLAVRYRCGWLIWPAGRPSGRGRPLHTLHNAHDPAGAARRLARTPAASSPAARQASPEPGHGHDAPTPAPAAGSRCPGSRHG